MKAFMWLEESVEKGQRVYQKDQSGAFSVAYVVRSCVPTGNVQKVVFGSHSAKPRLKPVFEFVVDAVKEAV